jgi:GH24 family phage-related lysozyme (muramidase)
MSYQDIAKLQIMADEGFSLKLYKCTAGKWSIGAGRNLEDRGITRAEGLFLLDGDLIIAEADAKGLFPNFHELTENRKAVLINMAFNLGQELSPDSLISATASRLVTSKPPRPKCSNRNGPGRSGLGRNAWQSR